MDSMRPGLDRFSSSKQDSNPTPRSFSNVPIAPSASSGPRANRSINVKVIAANVRAGRNAFKPCYSPRSMHRTARVFMLLGLLGVASRSHGATPTMSPDELRAGQKAVVKTVFEGQKVESFEAEIVGVLKGGASEGDMILARATTDRVKHTGIAQGMSGSPVYVDGRLGGALSGGWGFMRDPLFVVTP